MNSKNIPPIQAIPTSFCQNLKFIFCDIDDTLTYGGKLPAEAFTALWKAKNAGISVIPVTGRPAGWADQIARLWPVSAVIAENGGCYFWMDGDHLKVHYIQSAEERENNHRKLFQIAREILKKFPSAALAKDQPYRTIDVAIDFAEDAGPLSRKEVIEIAQIFQSHGAKAKISSIHVNAWFGEFDKLSTCKILASHLWGISPETLKKEAVYCGDSPNDEVMFQWFEHSIGVANISNFYDILNYLPTYITSSEGGYGFAEAIDVILSKR